MTTTTLDFIARNPIFKFEAATSAVLHSGTHREDTSTCCLICYLLPSDAAFWENYGCGCAWSVPEKDHLGGDAVRCLENGYRIECLLHAGCSLAESCNRVPSASIAPCWALNPSVRVSTSHKQYLFASELGNSHTKYPLTPPPRIALRFCRSVAWFDETGRGCS